MEQLKEGWVAALYVSCKCKVSFKDFLSVLACLQSGQLRGVDFLQAFDRPLKDLMCGLLVLNRVHAQTGDLVIVIKERDDDVKEFR